MPELSVDDDDDLARLRRYFTEDEQRAYTRLLVQHGGMYTSRRVRPRFWAGVGKTLAIAATGVLAFAMIATGSAGDVRVAVGGGIRGTITVGHCAERGMCRGTFVSGPADPDLVLDDVVVETAGPGTVRVGATTPGAVAAWDSTHAYVHGSMLPLVPFALAGGAVLGLLVMVLGWPVRAAIHVWRPDLWPYWIGERGRDLRTPLVIRGGRRVARVLATVLVACAACGLGSGVAGTYGVVAALAVTAVVVTRRILRRRWGS